MKYIDARSSEEGSLVHESQNMVANPLDYCILNYLRLNSLLFGSTKVSTAILDGLRSMCILIHLQFCTIQKAIYNKKRLSRS